MKNVVIITMVLCILGSGAADALAGKMHIGAGVRLGPIGVRLEWESLEGGAYDNLSMVSLAATLGF